MKLTASEILSLLVFDHLKHILTLIIDKSLSCLLMKPEALEAMMPSNHHHHSGGNHRDNPASLVAVPVCFFAEAVKSQLHVMPYTSFLNNKSNDHQGSNLSNNNKVDCVCIVCLNRIELSHEVRVPSNCSHVFHKECLDVWVDQGQGTCPLCRAKLILPITQNHDDHQAGDPYRRERMIYLFGEDYLFGDDE